MLVILTGEDLTVHQIRFEAHIAVSVQWGTLLWCSDLYFWLYLTMQTPLCQHCCMLPSLCARMCLSSDCGDHNACSMDELISLWYSHARALMLKDWGRTHGKHTHTHTHTHTNHSSDVILRDNVRMRTLMSSSEASETYTHNTNLKNHTRLPHAEAKEKKKHLFMSDYSLTKTLTCLDVYVKGFWRVLEALPFRWYFLTFQFCWHQCLNCLQITENMFDLKLQLVTFC